ncbi:hypothetical protein DL769_004002 [Monosporascus sp. CRB-8-3]|nr:hypothetical protein DL769_004002 [Monosporascus sp. CRB-8-3]
MSSRQPSGPSRPQGSRVSGDPEQLAESLRHSSLESEHAQDGADPATKLDRNLQKLDAISARRRENLLASNLPTFAKPATRRVDEALKLDRGTEPPYNPGDARKPQNPMYRQAPIHNLAPSFQYRYRSAAFGDEGMPPETPVMDNPRLPRPYLPIPGVMKSIEKSPAPVIGTVEQFGTRRSISMTPGPGSGDTSSFMPTPSPAFAVRTPRITDRLPGPYTSQGISALPRVKLDETDELLEHWDKHAVMARITSKHFEMLGAMSIAFPLGPAEGRYLKWRITGANFWEAANAQSPIAKMLVSKGKPKMNTVFVEINRAGPAGQFMSLLVKDPRYVNGLFIQAFGVPNLVPCELCERRHCGSETPDQSGMFPFFGCRSIPGFAENSCGNCVGSIEGHRCTFRDDRFKALRANFKRKPQVVEDLNDSNCPAFQEITGSELQALLEDHITDPTHITPRSVKRESFGQW